MSPSHQQDPDVNQEVDDPGPEEVALATETGRPYIIATPAISESEFQINITTFIPGNHITCCFLDRCEITKQLSFAGNNRIHSDGTAAFSPTATAFRTRQLLVLVPDESVDPDGFKEGTYQRFVGETKSYAPNALIDGRIDGEDDDGVEGDCHLLHQSGRASDETMLFAVRRISPHVVEVRLLGDVPNPIANGPDIVKTITWNFIVTIDTSDETPRWNLAGQHDGFPAYEIYINNIPIYTYDPGPPPYSFSHHLRKLAPPMDRTVNNAGELP